MSDNKYIIDKDSLTGIADAVRDKLGTGEATTDPQTGDIVYPEDKGYYLKETTIAKWEKSETTDSWSSSGTSYVTRANVTEEQLLRVCNGVRPVYVKIDTNLTSAGGDIIVENSLTSWSDSNHIVTLPTSGRFFCQYSYYHSTYYTSGMYFEKTIPAATFSFLDENQKIIIPENASEIVDGSYNRNLLQESVEMPIPFSIDDIQNKIVNLSLSVSGGGGLKIFKCYNKSSISNSEGDGWKVSNYLAFNAYFDLNFSSTSPYITTQVPDLNPENIIYMRYVGKNQSSGYTRSFIFDPTLKDVEHYTSASSSNGKRLSSTTDYYFFPDGDGAWSNSNKYGIMGMWDANNKILDLGLQEVSSRSGTYVASNYTVQYYNIPVSLIIVYKT